MWKVRETEQIGVRTLWQVFKTMPDGTTISRGRYPYQSEAEQLADKLNEEEGYHERME